MHAEDGDVQLMSEPTAYTDVADAFDGDDPFDFNIRVGFSRELEKGTITREATRLQTIGDGTQSVIQRGQFDVAEYERRTNKLMLGVDVGLFHDVMATLRMPLILSDDRTFRSLMGDDDSLLRDAGDDDANPNGRLFDPNFESPTRAGVDYLGIGLTWALLNQHRTPQLPTWIIALEGQLAIGEPMHPCQPSEAGTICGNPGLDTNFNNDAGSSHGVSGFKVETRASWRYRYVEPYGGLMFKIRWPSTAKDYFSPAGDLAGFINNLPSRIANAEVGMAIIPWENRARWQRFAIDLRLNGTFVSEGHEYSALFDALGTSQHQKVYEPVGEDGYTDSTRPAGPTLASQGLEAVPFYGLTDVQSHMRYGFRAGVQMRAAKYVQFAIGARLNWVSAYALSFSDPCNPGIADTNRAGICAQPDGDSSVEDASIANPHHRQTFDVPGRRFFLEEAFILDLYLNATAMF